MAQGKPAAARADSITTKMAMAKERLGAEVKVLGDLIEREILKAGEWPPAPEISLEIKQRSLALGARAVKLLDAVDKLETTRAGLERENQDLSDQVHDLRMKSSGISPAELAHLRMENEVLKDHVSQLETAISSEGSETAALQAENAKLATQLKELEEEVHRLLGASTEADEAKEARDALQERVDALEAELDGARAGAGGEPASGVLATIWAEGAEEGNGSDGRVAALKEKIAALELENEQLMEKGRRRLEEIKRQRDDLAGKVVELAESSAERAEQAIEEIIRLQKEREELKEALEAAQGASRGAQDTGRIIRDLEAHIGELEAELDAKDEEIARLAKGGEGLGPNA